MPKGDISKKESGEISTAQSTWVWPDPPTNVPHRALARFLVERGQWSPGKSSPVLRSVRHIQVRDDLQEIQHFLWLLLALRGAEETSTMRIEQRLEQLEEVAFGYRLKVKRLEGDVAMLKGQEEAEEQDWPAFATEEFAKLVENIAGLQDAREDKSVVLYHILEIETLLEKLERKARAIEREYEARLAASLRDICKIHEPSELSDRQISCFTASLLALIEGWGDLNREKLKWIRARLLEVGLTWLPVTRKAQMVIEEAKSSTRSSK